MKSIIVVAVIAAAASLLSVNASAQSLLGLDLGNKGSGVLSLTTSGGNTTIGVLGADITLPTGGSSNSAGLPGVLEVSGTPTAGGGSSVGVSILGGSSQGNSLNPLGLLGSGGGLGIGLPKAGSVIGGGGNGGNGGNGGDGNGNGRPIINIYASTGGTSVNGGDGNGNGRPIINIYASTGGTSVNGGNGGKGGNGGSFTVPTNISSRMQTLLRILAARNYLRLANGKAVCLTAFDTAEVSNWVPRKDWPALQGMLSTYAQDIFTLRQLLANCRAPAQREALNLTNLNRVIAIDIGKQGQPVLYML